MAHAAPGKSHREGISLMQLIDMFPDEESARKWFEDITWPKGRYCPKCGSTNTHEAKHAKSPYRCRDCKKYFSVKTGTVMAGSPIPLRKWAFAIYMEVVNLKGVSAMKLHRDLDVSYPTAWFMLHRIREAFGDEGGQPMQGPVEVDETYVGGRRRNMSNSKRRELKDSGRGAVGKAAVVGAKDRGTKQVRAKVVEATDRETLHGFIRGHVADDATVYTDEATAYAGMPNPHETVKHSVSEYVRDMAHTNGIESFWSMLKRGYMGTYHKMSAKHLQRYVNEFAGRHGMRDLDTISQLQSVVAGMVGKRLMWRELTS